MDRHYGRTTASLDAAAFITRAAQYALNAFKQSSVCPSVCLSRRLIAPAECGGFAAEFWRGNQISVAGAAKYYHRPKNRPQRTLRRNKFAGSEHKSGDNPPLGRKLCRPLEIKSPPVGSVTIEQLQPQAAEGVSGWGAPWRVRSTSL